MPDRQRARRLTKRTLRFNTARNNSVFRPLLVNAAMGGAVVVFSIPNNQAHKHALTTKIPGTLVYFGVNPDPFTSSRHCVDVIVRGRWANLRSSTQILGCRFDRTHVPGTWIPSCRDMSAHPCCALHTGGLPLRLQSAHTKFASRETSQKIPTASRFDLKR